MWINTIRKYIKQHINNRLINGLFNLVENENYAIANLVFAWTIFGAAEIYCIISFPHEMYVFFVFIVHHN